MPEVYVSLRGEANCKVFCRRSDSGRMRSEWLILPLLIQEVSDSNLAPEIGHPD
jgi:hypothetical protein